MIVHKTHRDFSHIALRRVHGKLENVLAEAFGGEKSIYKHYHTESGSSFSAFTKS